MKKIFILLITFLFVGLYAHASWDSTLNKINDIMNTIDRTEYTMNRAKNKIPNYTPPKTTGYPQTRTTTSPTYQQTYDNNNEYQNTTTDNMPMQQQTEEQKTSIPQGNQYSQDRVFKGQASTLGELPAGAIVMDPKSVWSYRDGDNYSGEIVASHPVFWRKLEDNHYVDGSTLLLSEVRVAKYPFCHYNKGLRAWDESDVRRFLRTTFYTHLSDGFKNAIVNVNIPFADLNGKPQTVNDNLFLLSIVEWGLSDRANNGSVIKYNDLPNIYKKRNLRYVKIWKAYEYVKNGGSSTRTINRPKAEAAGYKYDFFRVTGDGVLETSNFWFQVGVRPAVNLKSDTKISGPYKFNYYVNNSKSLIYYALEF